MQNFIVESTIFNGVSVNRGGRGGGGGGGGQPVKNPNWAKVGRYAGRHTFFMPTQW